MRAIRILAAAVATAAMLGAPGHADDGNDDGSDTTRSGAWMYINPHVGPHSVDFQSFATASGTALGKYVSQFTIEGIVEGTEDRALVNAAWQQPAARPGRSRVEHHVYSLDGMDTATFVFTGALFAPGSAVPELMCISTLRIKAGEPEELSGTC